ncbi:MAG TPA: sialate O-acetylesterase [Opitutaceae bacterium]|jgi:sialate O-acetylesterase
MPHSAPARRPHGCRLIAIVAVLCATQAASAQATALPFLSPVFGSDMVLQRGKPNAFWGWTTPGARVTVEVGGRSATGVAQADGRWQAGVTPPPAGGPYTVTVIGPVRAELHEVLVGDVWLCGGQSNMALPLSAVRDGAAETKAASNPEIRLFRVADHASYQGTEVPAGEWRICSPGTAGSFSAVAYYYARSLQDRLHVPIGLIEDCVGGTPVETWMSPGTLAHRDDFKADIAEMGRLKALGGPQYGNYVMHWYDQYDAGAKGDTWGAAGLDDSSWKTVPVPGAFAALGVGAVPAVIWLRREITLPDPLPAGAATLFLGSVEKMDTAYINGKWVGASSWVENPRRYDVPLSDLRPGRNVIALRILKLKPDEGFLDKPEVLQLSVGGTSTPLAGDWRGIVSVDARPPHPMPLGYENYPTMPTVLYQGMIEPLAPLAIRGAIWYQGEANAARAYQYRTLLPAMIADWRKLFGQGDFPFYIVSLPAFMHHRDEPPAGDEWAELREAQAMAARSVGNSGLAVTIDTGEPDNIHPKEKKVVGERLALCALAGTYGQRVVSQGPTYASKEAVPGGLRLHFRRTDGGLVARGGAAGEFSVAGKDRIWHWAQARIDGDDVVVSSPEVPRPEAARYAWQSFPKATLYNGAGLPAVPFRTDDWPGVTATAR